jgi:anaerobic selenocysteine-containing dehydrogenase
VQYTEAVVPPQHERREEWRIFGQLCRELGFKGPLDEGDTPNVFGRVERMLERGGVSFSELQTAPGGVLLPPNQPGRFFSEHLQTTDAKVDCRPALFEEALQLAEQHFAELESEPPGRLRLISKRDRFMHNSWFHNVEKMKHGDRAQNHLFMHPDDLARLDLREGQLVRVRSENGEVQLPVRSAADLMPGVVAATHGWGNAESRGMRVAQEFPGSNVNRLLGSGPGTYDPLSNMAHMTGVVVEVESASLGEPNQSPRAGS